MTDGSQAAEPQPMQLDDLRDEPLVSVLIANYNYGRYLCDAVQSLNAQTYPYWELIVCDDGSTDDSSTVLADLAKQHPRITAVFKENGGQASAWNVAYEHARGEVIALLDADDWFHPDKLDKVVSALKRHPRAGLVYHQMQRTDAGRQPIMKPFPEELPAGWLCEAAMQSGGVGFQPSTTSILGIRREFTTRLFPIPEELRHAGDAYIGMAAAVTTEIAAIPEPLAYYRQHGDNDSGMGNVEPLHFQSMHRWVEVYLLAFQQFREYLRKNYSEEVANRVRAEDLHVLRKYLPPLYILSGKPEAGIHGFSATEILNMLPPSRRTELWRLLFALPAPAARRLLLTWWAEARWKRLAIPLASALGLRENE